MTIIAGSCTPDFSNIRCTGIKYVVVGYGIHTGINFCGNIKYLIIYGVDASMTPAGKREEATNKHKLQYSETVRKPYKQNYNIQVPIMDTECRSGQAYTVCEWLGLILRGSHDS